MQSPSYELKLKSKTDRGRDIYEFKSADGIPSKNSFRDAELAIADTVKPEVEDDILTVQSGYGFLSVILADQAHQGTTIAAEISDRARQLIRINLDKNEIKNASVEKVAFYDEIDRNFDKIVYAPRDYESVDVVKNRISNLVKLLDVEGKLYVAGKKTSGINRYRSYLKSLKGDTQKITQNGKQRVYQYTKSEEFEPEKIEIETSFKAEVNGLELSFAACKGLFSPNDLDEGTKKLIENIELTEEDKVLDLACGYGVIGIFLNKFFDSDIHLTDDNSVATYYSKENLQLNDIEKYSLKNRDCLDGFKDEKFDCIVSNPPTHQGENITDEMFNQSHKVLRNGGELYLVYNQNMEFEDKLSQIFRKTEILEKSNNYLVLKAIK